MVRTLPTLRLLALCLILVSLTYYEIVFQRNSNVDTRQNRTCLKFIYMFQINRRKQSKNRNKSLELVQNGIFWSDYAK